MRIQRQHTSGFSLLEMLVVLVIIGLVLSLSVPTFKTFLTRSKSEVLANQLMRSIQLARSQALVLGVPVILCPSLDHVSCTNTWSDGQIIIADNAEKTVLAVLNLPKQAGVLRWRSSLNQTILRFYADGTTHYTAGTFWYCVEGAKHPEWEIRMNSLGRARFERVEDVSIVC